MKDVWRQDRKESKRLQRQAEMEIQFKQVERMIQQDADRLELKKRKANREERVILVDTEMQAKRLQYQTQALQLWKDEIKTIMETKKALISEGRWDDMSDEEKAVFKIPAKSTFY
jgi:hypothetical protein